MKKTSRTYHIIRFIIQLVIIAVVAWTIKTMLNPKDENTQPQRSDSYFLINEQRKQNTAGSLQDQA